MAARGLSKYKNDRFQFTHTLTQRKGGTEYTAATDGRRITVISTSTYKEDTDDTTQEWHSNKGEKSKENEQAPKWTQVLPAIFRRETSVDLSYYSFLAKGLKGPAKGKHIDSPLLDKGQYIVVNSTDGFLSLNPIYVRDAYKQIVDLGKKLGFPPIVKLQYNDAGSPVKFSAEHNGIKWQYVLMPVHRNQEATPGDIILGQQPSIYGQQDTGSFSIFSPSENTGIKALQSCIYGKNDAVFRSDTLNLNVILPFGSAGHPKDPNNPKSKIVGAHGYIHMVSMRMAHGESLEEAVYTTLRAIMAAVNGQVDYDLSNSKQRLLRLNGYRCVVNLEWDFVKKAWMLTGFKENGEKSTADDKKRALHLI